MNAIPDEIFVAQGSINAALEGNSEIKVHYLSSRDELGVLNEKVANDCEATIDIGQNETRKRFLEPFGQLVKRGIISANEFDTSSVEVTYMMQAEGSTEGISRAPRIKEYESSSRSGTGVRIWR